MKGLPSYDLKIFGEIVSQDLQDKTRLSREELDNMSRSEIYEHMGVNLKIVDGNIPEGPIKPKYYSYEEINFKELLEDT